jgi:tight adherence protein B
MSTLLTWLLSLACVAAAGLLLTGLCLSRARARGLKRLDELLDGEAAPLRRSALKAALPEMLTRRLLRAGWDPQHRHLLITLAAWLAVVIATAATGGLLAGALAGVTMPLALWAFLEYRAAKNMALLAESMLGLLERIRQLLSVGHSLQTALQRAVENSPPVVGRALASTLRRIANGAGVADSVERAAAELDLYELHLLATAARTNLRFGGSMGALLKNMIENVRRRATVERELRANTTQTRASAWVLALLPMVVAGVVMNTNHAYAGWFLATESGHHMILYAAISQSLGILAMRTITRTRY